MCMVPKNASVWMIEGTLLMLKDNLEDYLEYQGK